MNTTKKQFVLHIATLLLIAFSSQSVVNAQPSTTVYTCQGAPVVGYHFPEISPAEKAAALSFIAIVYETVQVLSEATTSYNCHTYAYHLAEGYGNTLWINNDQLSKYWNDCYQITANPAAAVKIYYAGDHSAIPSVSGKYDSKWGPYPLIRHDPTHVPLEYSPNAQVYYERLPPPLTVSIAGPTDLYSGQTGNYTANIANGNGTENCSWEIQEQYTSNGQYSSWMPLNGGSPTNRSVLMMLYLRSFNLKVTVSNNIHSATQTLRVGNNDNGSFRFAALSAAPNPFSSSTVLSYTLAKDASVLLEVFSSDRHRMVVLANGKAKAGAQEYRVDAASWASGTYIAELTITDETNTSRKESITLILTR